MTGHATGNASERAFPVRTIASIGGEIRQVRRSKNLTIEALAERVDRSVAHISKLERGLAEPSLRDLYAISQALEVPVAWLLSERNPGPAEESGLIERSGSHRVHEQGGILTEVLSPVLGREIEVMRSVFQPSAATPRRRSAHRKREDGYLLSGELELYIDDRKFLLQAGDSYSYLTDTVHYCRNPGPEPAVLFWITSRVKRD
ncbi:helix-turn-helix domain-containing protein [Afifella sp. IM 167]|uniref:helix-turn-helix domain-containing protein n=1 Tax=Afifella sp. IM 167 TaxID=2033586 RepID=UPI001CCF0483|nr:XRE family transcriptional regulator [Afifella sp. IM 167]